MRNEIEELKLKLFWSKHTVLRLRSLILYHGRSVKCPCYSCRSSKRTGSEGEVTKVCIWQPIFEKILKDCGLTFCQTYSLLQNDTHLGSGLGGDWRDIMGFTGLRDIKSLTFLNRYEDFVKKVYRDATSRFNCDADEMEIIRTDDTNIDAIYMSLDTGLQRIIFD
jgi:hypothetical protein